MVGFGNQNATIFTRELIFKAKVVEILHAGRLPAELGAVLENKADFCEEVAPEIILRADFSPIL